MIIVCCIMITTPSLWCSLCSDSSVVCIVWMSAVESTHCSAKILKEFVLVRSIFSLKNPLQTVGNWQKSSLWGRLANAGLFWLQNWKVGTPTIFDKMFFCDTLPVFDSKQQFHESPLPYYNFAFLVDIVISSLPVHQHCSGEGGGGRRGKLGEGIP